MSKPHQKRPKQRALRVDRAPASAPQDRQRPESRAQHRYLTLEQRKEIVLSELLRDSQASDRSIGAIADVSHTMVGRARAKLIKQGLVERRTATKGLDGVLQPVRDLPITADPNTGRQRKPAAISMPIEHGRLVVGDHDLGPAKFNPQTGVIEAGPHVAEPDDVTIVLPYSLVKAIERYNQTLWSAKNDPSRLGALNAVAYIGEQVAAILRTCRAKAKS